MPSIGIYPGGGRSRPHPYQYFDRETKSLKLNTVYKQNASYGAINQSGTKFIDYKGLKRAIFIAQLQSFSAYCDL